MDTTDVTALITMLVIFLPLILLWLTALSRKPRESRNPEKEIKRIKPTLNKVLELEDTYAAMSEEELKKQDEEDCQHTGEGG